MTARTIDTLAERRRYYDRAKWGTEEAYQVEVCRDIMDLLPSDASSILDLGCGDGFITNQLPLSCFVMGVEISLVAVQRLTHPACLAPIAQLPLVDRAFDLVMANDVLEHIPHDEFSDALQELQRVASRYIIITVPFHENLRARSQYSPDAGGFHHVNEHVREFDIPMLKPMLSDFDIDSVVFTGVEWQEESSLVENFKRLVERLETLPTAESHSKDCPPSEEGAGILRLLRAEQARMVGRSPDIVDNCRLRTEVICLYRRRDAQVNCEPIPHKVRARSVHAETVPVAAIDLNQIDFRKHERHVTSWLPTMSRFPYVVMPAQAVASAAGALFIAQDGTATWEFKIGFFCNFEGMADLELVGSSEGTAALTVAHYGAAHEYRQIGTAHVDGPFQITMPDIEVTHSQYGALFSVAVTGPRIVFESIRIASPQPAERSVYVGNMDYLRVSDGGTDCFLSGRYYGGEVPVLSWFRAPGEIRCQPGLGSDLPAQVVTVFDHAGRLIDRLSEQLHNRDVRAAKLIDELASVRADANAQVASVRQEAANRIAAITGELSAARHDCQLRSGRIGALRELLRINDSIDLDGSAKQGTRLTALAKLYFSHRRSLFAAGLRRVHALRAKNRVVEREPADLRPMEEIAPYTITMLVADDRIDRRVLLSARSLYLAGWKVAVISVPYPDLIDHDQVEFPELAISRIDTTRAISLPPEAFSGEDHYALDWQKVYFYHYHFLAAALRNPARVYVAHDLPVLAAAAAAAKQVGAALVYDAHELYPEIGYFSEKQRTLYARAEAALIKDADLVTTINELIATEMAARYDITLPQVILNAPAGPGKLPIGDHLLRRDLNIPIGKRILLYQGSLSLHRNLENLVAAMARVEDDDIVLVMMGPGVDRRHELEAIAVKGGTLGRRVLFHDAVPQAALLSYTTSADVGIVPYPAVDLNSSYCTPNKLFEFIVAGLPILANDLPELRKFVLDNGFGQVHSLDGPAQIARAIDGMFRSDLEVYRQRLAARQHEFIWDVQGEKLVSLYRPLAGHDAEKIPKAA